MTRNFDPANLDGFTKFLFELLGRFRDVAIENHISSGNLSDLTAHTPGVVSGEQLLNHFEPPVVFSVINSFDDEPVTVIKQEGTLELDVAVFYWDYDRIDGYGLENAVRLTGNVIHNVEQNRELKDSNNQDPLATDTGFTNLEPGYEFSRDQNAVLNWCSVRFEIDIKRNKPT